MGDVDIIKCNNILRICFLNINVVFTMVIICSSVTITMIEKSQESADEEGAFIALLSDLSKVFDCLPHDVMIAKIHAYDFDMKSLNLRFDYMINRKKRAKVDGI